MQFLFTLVLSMFCTCIPAFASPSTGDYSNMTLWITLFAVAVVLLLTILAIVIHKNSKRK